MSHPILITGAAGGAQGSTGRLIATTLLPQRIPVRAFVHKLDARSDELRRQGAEILEGETGRNPQKLEEFFRTNAGSFGADATRSKSI